VLNKTFGKEDNDEPTGETENRVKDGNFLPPEMGMLIQKDKT